MQALVILGWLVLGFFQITAYAAGIKLWLGLGTLGAIIAFFVTAAIPFGALIDAAISFYGAYAVWHWTWWQSALLTFPFAILGIALNGLTALSRFLERRRGVYRFPKL